MAAQTVLSIGNFDGVHIGHAALVRRARKLAGPDGRVVVISFDPHPATVLRPERTPPRLTTFERRTELLRAAGADVVEKLAPTPEVLAMSAEEFVRDLVKRYAPTWIVGGTDFDFGQGRSGTLDLLRSLSEASGYSLRVEPSVTLGLHDQSIAPASSSLTRWLLANERVSDAALVLGRPHRLEGVVVWEGRPARAHDRRISDGESRVGGHAAGGRRVCRGCDTPRWAPVPRGAQHRHTPDVSGC